MICFYIFTQVIDHQQKLCGIVIHRWHAPIVGKTWFIQKSSWVRTKWGEIISQEALWFFCTNLSRKHFFYFYIAFIEWIFHETNKSDFCQTTENTVCSVQRLESAEKKCEFQNLRRAHLKLRNLLPNSENWTQKINFFYVSKKT